METEHPELITIDTPQPRSSLDTGIHSLLDEETAKIFAFLNVEERQKIRPVCRRWRKIVDEAFGMKIRIKNSTSELISMCPNAVDVELHSMTIPFESGISFSQTVKILRFTSIVVTYNLANFLRNCSSITTLFFTNVVIDQPIGDEWSQKFWREDTVALPLLEKIEIKCFNFAEGISDITRLLHDRFDFGNLKEICILAQNPPTLPLELLFAETPDLANSHCILQLLWKNRASLTHFQIGRQNYPIIMKFLDRDKFRDPTVPLGRNEYVSAIQLEEFLVHPYFREEWAPLLKTQFNIINLDIGSVNVSRWDDIRQVIIRNSATLQSFTIGGLSFGQVWDCSVFESCHSLTTLSIMISHSHKFNMHKIPQQLLNLHLFGPVSMEEIMSIAENLVNLDTLKFSHLGRIAIVGGPEDERVNIALVKALLKLPKLTLLSFVVCSSLSIDWDRIAQWCRNIEGDDIQLEEHFYQMHGENCRNGLTLKISENFDRGGFDWDREVTIANTGEAADGSQSQVTHRRSVHFNLSTFSFP
ncbi:hypothetical protein Ocin01_05555 [Orchesella cincta]|uniref:F-box domain-containing protein n=1 Tax=Orchesella cincta TaxID=48709 RepID=A0A1D2N7S6_ORCCI|nr:hypothetical protein Ocin01_05555 [Orchesella cincta]